MHEDEKNQTIEQRKAMEGGSGSHRRYREKEPKEVEREYQGQRQQAPRVPSRTFRILCSVSDVPKGSRGRANGVWPTGKNDEELDISMGTHSREMLRALSSLRADLRGMKAQVKSKMWILRPFDYRRRHRHEISQEILSFVILPSLPLLPLGL